MDLLWKLMALSLYACVNFFIIVIECERPSRVCYSSAQRNGTCDYHVLKCQDDKLIGIIDAQYKYINRISTECSCGHFECDHCSGDLLNKTAKLCSKPHSDVDYFNALSNCSYQTNCSIPVPSQQNHTCLNSLSTASYSQIRYMCTEDNIVVDFCNGTKSGEKFTLLFKKSSNKSHCWCNLEGTPNSTAGNITNYVLRSLDIRNNASEGGGYFNLSFASGNFTKNIVNKNVKQYDVLFQSQIKQESVIRLTLDSRRKGPDRIWIHVKGRGKLVNITCQSEVKTTTGNPASTTSSTPTVLTKATETATEAQESLSTQAGLTVAPVAGGVVGGVVVIAAISVLIIFRRSRNKSTDESKGSDINPIYNETEDVKSLSEIEDKCKDAVVLDDNNDMSGVKTSEPEYFQPEPLTTKHNYSNAEGCAQITLPANPHPQHDTKDIDHRVTDSEDCYNHLGTDANQRSHLNVDYDTTASAAKAVKDLENQDDYYSYDHLGTSTEMAVTDNVYDTTLPRILDTK